MSVFADEWTDFGGGRRAGVGALKDAALHTKLKNYKKLVAKRYRVVFPDNIERYLPDGDLWISTKIDGELWFLIKHQGEVALVAYNGRVVQGIPVAAEAAKLLADAPDMIIPGELFGLPPEGGRPRVGHVATALHNDDRAKTLGFKAFDLLEVDGEDWLYQSYRDRYEKLTALLGDGKRCAVVTTVEGEKADASQYFSEWVKSEKFEGVVARSEQGITYKIKPFITLDAVVIAFGERQEDGKTQVRELTLALLRDDGTMQILGTVGNGMDEGDRVTWHKRLSEIEVQSSFRMANREGTLCRFVKPEIVVEVKVSDIVDTDSRDLPVRRMALKYDEQNGYSALGTLPIVSLIHPVLVGERSDKLIDGGSVGLDQVYAHVPFAGRDLKASARDLAQSEVFERRVWTKSARGGGLAVRKLVAFATNKAEEDPNYPPYVAFFTDFSPGRKEPLQTDMRVGATKDSIEAHVAAWVEKNVKRGWEEVL